MVTQQAIDAFILDTMQSRDESVRQQEQSRLRNLIAQEQARNRPILLFSQQDFIDFFSEHNWSHHTTFAKNKKLILDFIDWYLFSSYQTEYHPSLVPPSSLHTVTQQHISSAQRFDEQYFSGYDGFFQYVTIQYPGPGLAAHDSAQLMDKTYLALVFEGLNNDEIRSIRATDVSLSTRVLHTPYKDYSTLDARTWQLVAAALEAGSYKTPGKAGGECVYHYASTGMLLRSARGPQDPGQPVGEPTLRAYIRRQPQGEKHISYPSLYTNGYYARLYLEEQACGAQLTATSAQAVAMFCAMKRLPAASSFPAGTTQFKKLAKLLGDYRLWRYHFYPEGR